MKLRHKILTAIFLISVLLIIPVFGTGAMWIRHVGLLPGTAVVFSDDAAAMDRFMASALKRYYGDRVGICDGTNDHVEIQAALDAVRDVKLSVGQFNCEVAIDINNSNQTLRGCGRNTILTTTTANLDIITATGGNLAELVGILIADLCVDGNAGGVANDVGILWTYVDYSKISNVWSLNNGGDDGIYLKTSDKNIIIGNTCQGNGDNGIYLLTSNDNTISGNTCQGNGGNGIRLHTSSNNNTVSGNTCQGNERGIYVSDSHNNTVSGNTCQGNSQHGIRLYTSSNNTISGNTCQGNGQYGIVLQSSSNNTVTGNTLTENSQTTTNTYDDIFIEDSDYNNIQVNTCRAGALANKPRYGININNAASDKNLIANNDLYDDGFGTAPFNDVGTLTTVKSSNRGIEITQVRDYVYIKNTSGGASAIGDVARHKAVAAGNEYDTPAANGEDSVLGMVAEVIANNASGLVQIAGKTTVLKATNAGGNIAIGDYLCTENGVRARLAAAGDMSFARALEACAAADCTIDALIISPMKI